MKHAFAPVHPLSSTLTTKFPVASQSSCASQIARTQDGTPGKGAGNLECSARIKGLNSANRDVEKAVNALSRDRDFSIFL